MPIHQPSDPENARPVRLDEFSRKAIDNMLKHDPLEPNFTFTKEDADVLFEVMAARRSPRSYIFNTRTLMFLAGFLTGFSGGVCAIMIIARGF